MPAFVVLPSALAYWQTLLTRMDTAGAVLDMVTWYATVSPAVTANAPAVLELTTCVPSVVNETATLMPVAAPFFRKVTVTVVAAAAAVITPDASIRLNVHESGMTVELAA